MKQFRIVGDLSSSPFHSSRIIIDNTNKAAKELGLYSDSGIVVNYDTLANKHHPNPDAFWVAYETAFPKLVLKNLNGSPLIGLSRDNAMFATEGGYPHHLCHWVPCGVDIKLWQPIPDKLYNKDKFVFTTLIESTVRAMLPELMEAFGRAFSGRDDVVLYIKDREPTELFKEYVKTVASKHKINIIHDGRHTEDHHEEIKILQGTDVHIYLNRSGTFCLTALQGLACSIPSLLIGYSGPNEYLSPNLNALAIEWEIEEITYKRLAHLEMYGLKNYLFPLTKTNFDKSPRWAKPSISSIEKQLLELHNNYQYWSDTLRPNAILTARNMSWRNTAVKMSQVLENI